MSFSRACRSWEIAPHRRLPRLRRQRHYLEPLSGNPSLRVHGRRTQFILGFTEGTSHLASASAQGHDWSSRQPSSATPIRCLGNRGGNHRL
jgi:hypothetical protein